MAKKIRITYGDIFWLELPCKKYVAGKILFDVEKQSAEKGIDFENESYMNTFRSDCCQIG